MERMNISQSKLPFIMGRIFRYILLQRDVSKNNISQALNLSVPTILTITRILQQKGLIIEEGEFESTGGRKAKKISSIESARYAIGIAITKNHVSFVLTNLGGHVLSHQRIHLVFEKNDSYYLTLWEKAQSFLLATNIPTGAFLGYGISLPGIINKKTGMLDYSHALNMYRTPYEVFTKYFQSPCFLLNDADASLCAELHHVTNKKTTAYLQLSNTVGGSLYIKNSSISGKIIDSIPPGDNFRSYEFGHMTLYPYGITCYCGKAGCVDAYCNAKYLSDYTQGKLDSFFYLVEKGNTELTEVWDTYLNNLAIVLNNLHMGLDCNIIVGGYIGAFIEPYIATLQNRAKLLSTFKTNGSYIKPCTYKTESSAFGAALSQIEHFIYSIDTGILQ